MEIATWNPITEQRSEAPITGRLQPGIIKRAHRWGEFITDDTEVAIVAHPYGRDGAWPGAGDRERDITRGRELVQFLIHRPALRAVAIDHPRNDWRDENGLGRRNTEPLALFRRELLQPLHQAGLLVSQYGVDPGDHDTLPRAPVWWRRHAIGASWAYPHSLDGGLVWIRGIGQAGGPANDRVMTPMAFLHDLVAARELGADLAVVWFDPDEVTAGQLRLMARAIDIAVGDRWNTEPSPEPGGLTLGDFAKKVLELIEDPRGADLDDGPLGKLVRLAQRRRMELEADVDRRRKMLAEARTMNEAARKAAHATYVAVQAIEKRLADDERQLRLGTGVRP